jgi:hypothetical protein
MLVGSASNPENLSLFLLENRLEQINPIAIPK